jgi:TonB family protein
MFEKRYVHISFMISILAHSLLFMSYYSYLLKVKEVATTFLENIELLEIEPDIIVVQEMPGQVPPRNVIEFFKMSLPTFKKPKFQEITEPEIEREKTLKEVSEKIDFDRTIEVRPTPQISLTQDKYVKREKLSEIVPEGEVYGEKKLDMLSPHEPDIKIEEVGKVAVGKISYSQPIDLGKKTPLSPLKDIKEVEIKEVKYTYKPGTLKEAAVSIKKRRSTVTKPTLGYGKGTPLGYGKRVLLVKHRIKTSEDLKKIARPVAEKVEKTEVGLIREAKPEKKTVEIMGPVVGRKIITSYVPVYPDWARAEHIEADVVIRFYVSPEGKIREKLYLERTSGYSKLDRLAMEAIKKWVFAPLETDGGDQWGIITFRYLLK